VGALIPVKRFDILIQAFATLLRNSVNATLLIVGDGPERRALESLARTAGATERVIFVGAQEDVPGLLACMDIFACSSESESMSCAVLEAMAAALPMVVTDVGDNAAIVRDGVEGLVVPPGSAESLGRALAQLVVAPDLRRRMSTAAGRRAADFSFAAMVSGYRALYARFAGGCSEMKDSSAQHRDRRIGAAFV
jgi:glycosyltransferase involved in cell wall biosynthesis